MSVAPEGTSEGAPLTGYLHPDYAASLAGFGTPRLLPRSRGWILERTVASTGDRDAMGCYPLFCCGRWASLEEDLAELEQTLVSVSLVADPFGAFDEATLRRTFPDLCRPFKEHLVADLTVPVVDRLPQHHVRNLRRSRRAVRAEVCLTPVRHLDDWTVLHAHLTERHGIRGVAAFSRPAFQLQLGVPGIVAFRATEGTTTVGMCLWYVQGEVGYYHLGAYSARGYELRASYALFATALEHFRSTGSVRYAGLGAGAGLSETPDDGLSRFKRGWATGTWTAYLCGRVLDRKRYETLAGSRGDGTVSHFPAYRRGEFVSRQSGEELHVTLHLYTDQEVVPFTSGSAAEREWRDRPLPEGAFRTTCFVPGHLLNSGRHRFLVLIIKDLSHLILRYESHVRFDIVDLRDRKGGWLGREPGVVQPVLPWKTEFLGNDPAMAAGIPQSVQIG